MARICGTGLQTGNWLCRAANTGFFRITIHEPRSTAFPITESRTTIPCFMTREEIFKNVQSLAEEKDLFAASEYVLGLGDESTIVDGFFDLVLDCYWKAKSVEQVLHFGYVGIHYCLSRAAGHDANDAAEAKNLRIKARWMANNVASFTWPGWNEPGVTISREQMRQGLAFARYSIRQLHELELDARQCANTHWFLGAQLIAHRQYDEALKAFERARDYSKEQGDDLDALTMFEGYIGLTRILDNQKEIGQPAFDSAVTALKARDNEDAGFYAKQLVTARGIFEGK